MCLSFERSQSHGQRKVEDSDLVFATYPTTNASSYIKQLLEENDRLKGDTPVEAAGSSSASLPAVEPQATHEEIHNPDNPLLEDEAWFVSYEASPMYVGEAACTAFSTRFRQLLLNNRFERHVPRTQFIQDSQLASAAEINVHWPSRPQALLLVEITISTVGKCYHLSAFSALRNLVDRAYKNGRALDHLSTCKIFTVFALGEIYSSRPSSAQDSLAPGLNYFAKASKLLHVFPERPQIDHIELLILFSLYSLALNRRHSAYRYVGSAMRLGMTIGLHQNIREADLPDIAARQHRIRLWWTIYTIDRILGAKFGYPIFIRDSDIDVDFPSDKDLTNTQREDFISAEYMLASIGLARIAGDIIMNLYSRKKLVDTFSQRVHRIFRNLRAWFESLPGSMQLKSHGQNQVARHIVSLHLSFNQVC